VSSVGDQIVRFEDDLVDPSQVFLHFTVGLRHEGLSLIEEDSVVVQDLLEEVVGRIADEVADVFSLHESAVESAKFLMEIHLFESQDSVDVVLHFLEPLSHDRVDRSAEVKLLEERVLGWSESPI